MLRRTKPPPSSASSTPSCTSRSARLRGLHQRPCNSWVWAPANHGPPFSGRPLGEFGQHLGVQRVGLGVGPARQSPCPLGFTRLTGRPFRARAATAARSYPPVASIGLMWGQRFEPRDQGGDARGRVVEPARGALETQVRVQRPLETSMPTNRSVGVVALEIPWLLVGPAISPAWRCDLKGQVTVRGLSRTARRGSSALTHGREGLRGIELTRRWTPE